MTGNPDHSEVEAAARLLNLDPVLQTTIQQVTEIAETAFDSFDASDPVLGVTDDVIISDNLRELLARSSTVLATTQEGGKTNSFAFAVPIDQMDPSRAAEAEETAYIYMTAIEPGRQGEGLVKNLIEDLIKQLKVKGYQYIERDSLIGNGYADKVEKTYKDAIITMHDHNHYPEFGPSRFFRIDLSKLP